MDDGKVCVTIAAKLNDNLFCDQRMEIIDTECVLSLTNHVTNFSHACRYKTTILNLTKSENYKAYTT